MQKLLSEFVRSFMNRTHNVNKSAVGYEFQWELTEKLLKEFGHWPSVTFTDGRGEPVTLQNYKRKGQDGGIDIMINVNAKRPQDVKRIETLINDFLRSV